MTIPIPTERPVVHVAVGDDHCQTAIAEALDQLGCTMVAHASGLHLIHAISGLILGDQPWTRPALIVADARARGCSGLTIAAGLRDLGLHLPMVLVTEDRSLAKDLLASDIHYADTTSVTRVLAGSLGRALGPQTGAVVPEPRLGAG